MEQKEIAIAKAKQIMGGAFIGPEELESIAEKLGIQPPSAIERSIPSIPYSTDELEEKAHSHILVLIIPFEKSGKDLTLLSLRAIFGMDPSSNEPCFYNQDWYLNEPFAFTSTEVLKWHLISKAVIEKTRGVAESEIRENNLPSALCCAFTFFSYYLLHKEILWSDTFVWCCDTDSNGDRIYAGRYFDPKGIAKNGFSVHRHLRITPIYGCVDYN